MNDAEKEAFLLTLNKMTEKQKSTGKEMFVGVNRVLSDAESKSFLKNTERSIQRWTLKYRFLR